MNENIDKKLISTLLSAFDLPVKDIKISSDDVAVISAIANRQKIVPIVVEGLNRLGCSKLLTDQILKGSAKAVYDYTQRKVSLNEISEAFEKESIEYLLLKGSVLCDLYPQPWMRTCSDIDILVHEEDLAKAIKVLEAETSFKFQKHDRHDVHFVNEYVHLELHFSFEYSIEKIDNALSDPWNNTFKTDGSYQCFFTPEYNLFYIVTHAAKHFMQNGGIGIRPILDIYFLKTHTAFDEKKFMTYCNEAGVSGFYKQCSKLIDVWFNNDTHDNISKSFENIVVSGGVFGSKHLKLVSNKRNDSGKRYIGRRIFKSSEEIKNYFPVCRKHPILVPYYQVVRWTRMLRTKRPGEYVSEFKQANLVEQSEVEMYDKLMKAMGL